MLPWTGLPIKSVLVGTHVCCLLRRRAVFSFRARGETESQICQETCQDMQNACCQGSRAKYLTLKRSDGFVSVKACQGKIAVCQGVKVLSPDIFAESQAHAPLGNPLVFHLRSASQVLQIRSQYLNPGHYRGLSAPSKAVS